MVILETVNKKKVSNGMKEKVIEYCERTFFKKGIRKIKMDDVAGDLKISKKTIYKFFNSKEELIKAILKFKMRRIKKKVDEIEKLNETSVYRLYMFLELLLNDLSKISVRFFEELETAYPNISEEIKKLRRKTIYKFYLKMIEEGVREGLIKDIEPVILIESIFGIIDNVVNLEFITKEKFEIRYLIENVFEIIFGGILTQKGIKELNKIKGKQ